MVRGLRGRLLAPDADGEIQMDVVIGDKAVLEVARQARAGGGVSALLNRSAQHRLGIGGLDDVQRRPPTMASRSRTSTSGFTWRSLTRQSRPSEAVATS